DISREEKTRSFARGIAAGPVFASLYHGHIYPDAICHGGETCPSSGPDCLHRSSLSRPDSCICGDLLRCSVICWMKLTESGVELNNPPDWVMFRIRGIKRILAAE